MGKNYISPKLRCRFKWEERSESISGATSTFRLKERTELENTLLGNRSAGEFWPESDLTTDRGGGKKQEKVGKMAKTTLRGAIF